MLTIEIHVDTLEDIAASTRVLKLREDQHAQSANKNYPISGTRFRKTITRLITEASTTKPNKEQ
jgi:hypothetical protein